MCLVLPALFSLLLFIGRHTLLPGKLTARIQLQTHWLGTDMLTLCKWSHCSPGPRLGVAELATGKKTIKKSLTCAKGEIITWALAFYEIGKVDFSSWLHLIVFPPFVLKLNIWSGRDFSHSTEKKDIFELFSQPPMYGIGVAELRASFHQHSLTYHSFGHKSA